MCKYAQQRNDGFGYGQYARQNQPSMYLDWEFGLLHSILQAAHEHGLRRPYKKYGEAKFSSK